MAIVANIIPQITPPKKKNEDLIGPWGAEEEKINKFVIIGMALDRAYFDAAFREAVVIKP